MFHSVKKKLLLTAFVLISSKFLFAQTNIGFEKGTFDNWDFAIGKIYTDGSILAYPSIAVPGSFTLLKNDKTDLRDPFGNFSVFSPNGSKYCIKLGNSDYGNTVQQISYTMDVPASGSKSIIFDYAVVLQNPGHEPNQQPRFKVKIFNVTDGKYLDCPSFDFISSSNLPGFKFNSDGVFYKDWSSATINLTGLNNKQIRLEFTVNHCPFGAHFGYAYIDVNENIGSPIEGNSFCSDQDAITLSAPPGFASYTWFNSDSKKLLGTGQYLTLTPPPTDLTNLAVEVVPYNGLGCSDKLYTTLTKVDAELKFVVKKTIIGCPGTGVDLTQADVTAGSNPGLMFDYLTDSFELLPSPFQITQAGHYFIRATNAGGCSRLAAVDVLFGLPQLEINNPPPVYYPSTVDVSKSFTPQPDVSYSYYTDNAAKTPLPNFSEVQTSGTYFIKATSNSGCINIRPVVVTILPPDPYSLKVPNTFTPNGDGINDHFLLTMSNDILFKRLQIFNRNGTPVFDTTSATAYWDGTYGDKPVPSGTYYWVFEGYDSYYHKKVNKSSFITLIR